MIKIFVKAKPGSKIEKIEKLSENTYEVWVKEPPQKGKANKAILKLLKNHFKASDAEIILGVNSKQKIIKIYV